MDAGSDLIRQIVAVLFVFGLLAVVVWRLRGGKLTAPAWTPAALWNSGPVRSRSIIIVERQILTPQHGLHRLKVDQREFLIATHPQGCSMLAELGVKATDVSLPAERVTQ